MMQLGTEFILAIIGVGLVFTGIITNVITFSSGAISSFDMEKAKYSLNVPNNQIKVAAIGSDEIKQTAMILIGGREPYELAVSQDTQYVTTESIEAYNDFLGSRDVDTGIFMDLFGKCQGWLTAADPGAEVFEISPEVTNKYYGSLYSESEINLLNPVKISEYLADNIGTVNALCGDGCPNTRRCAECWDLIEELREADQAGNFDRTAELESEILTEGSDCPTACAEVCAEVYPKVRQATGSVLNPELGKGLISTGIQLN